MQMSSHLGRVINMHIFFEWNESYHYNNKLRTVYSLLIYKFISAKSFLLIFFPCEQLQKLVVENILAFNEGFWIRLAARTDTCKSEDDKAWFFTWLILDIVLQGF